MVQQHDSRIPLGEEWGRDDEEDGESDEERQEDDVTLIMRKLECKLLMVMEKVGVPVY